MIAITTEFHEKFWETTAFKTIRHWSVQQQPVSTRTRFGAELLSMYVAYLKQVEESIIGMIQKLDFLTGSDNGWVIYFFLGKILSNKQISRYFWWFLRRNSQTKKFNYLQLGGEKSSIQMSFSKTDAALKSQNDSTAPEKKLNNECSTLSKRGTNSTNRIFPWNVQNNTFDPTEAGEPQSVINDELEASTRCCHSVRDISNCDLLLPQCGKVLRTKRKLSVQSVQRLRTQQWPTQTNEQWIWTVLRCRKWRRQFNAEGVKITILCASKSELRRHIQELAIEEMNMWKKISIVASLKWVFLCFMKYDKITDL